METKKKHHGTLIKETDEKDGSKITIIKFVNTMQPAFLAENLYGVFRFHIVNDEAVPASRMMKLFTLLSCSVYITLFFIYFQFPTAVTGTVKIVEIMDELPAIVILLQYVLSTVKTSFFLNEGNIRILKSFADLDTKLHVNSNENFYKKSHRFTKRIVLWVTVAHFLFSVTDLLTESTSITVRNVMVLPIYLEQSIQISVFCLNILMLKRRLNVINNYLAKFIHEKDNNKATVFIVAEKKGDSEELNWIGHPSPDNMKIRDLAVAYDIIGETSGLINEVFNFQIFMTLVATFTYIVITIWSSLYYYKNSGDNFSLATIICWSVVAIFAVGFMSLTCERLLLTRTDTKILVNKIIMDYDLPKSMRVQAKAFMELIEAWPLRIFIYDMFSVDITLMLKYISVATTYLIVIIQISHFI